MNELWQSLVKLFEDDQTIIVWAVAVSLLTFFGSLIAVPIVVIQMKPDFFLENSGTRPRLTSLRILRHVAKNVLGWLLLLSGIAMLVLPGQGLLTMALGIGLVDFPGKRKLQLWLVRLKGVRKSIDWIRKRAEKPPLELPD